MYTALTSIDCFLPGRCNHAQDMKNENITLYVGCSTTHGVFHSGMSGVCLYTSRICAFTTELHRRRELMLHRASISTMIPTSWYKRTRLFNEIRPNITHARRLPYATLTINDSFTPIQVICPLHAAPTRANDGLKWFTWVKIKKAAISIKHIIPKVERTKHLLVLSILSYPTRSWRRITCIEFSIASGSTVEVPGDLTVVSVGGVSDMSSILLLAHRSVPMTCSQIKILCVPVINVGCEDIYVTHSYWVMIILSRE